MKITTPHGPALRRGLLPALAVGVLALSACSSGGSSTTAQDTGSSTGMTVTIQDANGAQVLATANGDTLYMSDQEKNKVLCTSGACEAIWTPLTASSGQPTAPGKVQRELTTIKRPDGTSQVAFDGHPLYTFSFDHAAGQVNGDGAQDSFDGTDFTWHAASPTGHAPAAAPSSPTTSPSYDNGYSY
jgi:predicted lipoprotein with Yx(FWY)xxD motif